MLCFRWDSHKQAEKGQLTAADIFSFCSGVSQSLSMHHDTCTLVFTFWLWLKCFVYVLRRHWIYAVRIIQWEFVEWKKSNSSQECLCSTLSLSLNKRLIWGRYHVWLRYYAAPASCCSPSMCLCVCVCVFRRTASAPATASSSKQSPQTPPPQTPSANHSWSWRRRGRVTRTTWRPRVSWRVQRASSRKRRSHWRMTSLTRYFLHHIHAFTLKSLTIESLK